MPNDTLGEEVHAAMRGVNDFLRSNQDDQRLRQYHLTSLKSAEHRLTADVDERSTIYLTELHTKESEAVDEKWATLNRNPKFVRVTNEAKAHQQTFEDLRRINGGAFPRNISPVLYVAPLIGLGVAEWYVNFSTFASVFIPVFAIASTIIVAAVFAWASHMHGTYLKQISEIMHPSVEYRNVLGRKIALVIATILLIGALSTIVWLRYVVIASQLGVSQTSASGTFGQPSGSMVWSRLGPTIVLNVLIWGVGTLYSWAMNEKIPDLRESYRALLRIQKKLDRFSKPVEAEEARIKSSFNREREKNDITIKEYRSLLDNVMGLQERLRQN